MLRLASATTSDIIGSRGTSWTYWDLRSNLTFGLGNHWLDYPDISVGDNFLYVSATEFIDPSQPPVGLLVMRIPLAQIQASGPISIDYTDASNSASAWLAHLSQRTGNAVFWAGHTSTSQMRI
ncbi:MAG: hypothetical protein L0Z50_33955 [Verrucomicrobiales bacterium]|nr:hypothetical protein [Verrucomicrobiales bacterium]